MQEIVNVRIDDRLIHGQVAAVWSLVTKASRIMVVDDLVVKDPVNKEALKMACPQQRVRLPSGGYMTEASTWRR